MIPQLITPPDGLPVSLQAMKTALALDGDHHDAMIEGLIAAATGFLDGFDGILNRAILPQTWRVSVIGAGPHPLPLPDVTAAVSSIGVPVTMERRAGGFEATAEGAVGAHDLDFTCALPAARLPAAAQLVQMLASYWYEQRLPVVGRDEGLPPLTAVQRSLIMALRWDGGS